MKRLLRTSQISIGCAGMLAAGFVTAADLSETYLRARESDPVYLMSMQTLAAVRERIPQARAALLPSVSANGSYGHADNQVRFGAGSDEQRDVETYGWNIQLTQPLIRMQNWAELSQAEAQVKQAEAELSGAEQDLALRVVQAYLGVLSAVDEIAAISAQESALRQQAEQAQASFKSGIVPITDLHEANSRLGLVLAQGHSAQGSLDAAVAEMEKLTGPIDTDLVPLREGVIASLEGIPPVDDWISLARASNPKVIAKTAAVLIQEKAVAKARSGHFPVLDLTASYGTNYTSGTAQIQLNTDSSTRASQVGVQVSVPIFGGGAVSARKSEASANLVRAKLDLELSRRESEAEARKSYADFVNGARKVAALESATASGGVAVQANAAGYRAGVRSNLDVLTAEQTFHAAARDLLRAKYEVLLSWMRLRASAGALGEADVLAIGKISHEEPTVGQRNLLGAEPSAGEGDSVAGALDEFRKERRERISEDISNNSSFQVVGGIRSDRGLVGRLQVHSFLAESTKVIEQ